LRKILNKFSKLYGNIKLQVEKTKKRDKKKDGKKKVQFSKEVKTLTIEDFNGERLWNDNKKRSDIRKGKFTEEEVDKLLHAICSFVKDNGYDEDTLLTLVTKPSTELNEDMKGAWCKIAETLPYRSV
jgi:hypothetical protein